MSAPEQIQVGERVRTRKPHPCGSDWWHVVRIGAEIGLQCSGCGRKIFLSRADFARRVRERQPPPAPEG